MSDKSSGGGGSVASSVSTMTRATSASRRPPSTVVKTEGGRVVDKKPNIIGSPFEGREPKLAGWVFTYGNDSANKYIKTVEEVLLYASKEFKHGDVMGQAYEDGKEPSFSRPTIDDKNKLNPTHADYDRTEHEIWKEKIKIVAQSEARYDSECRQFYSVIWGQCSTTIRDRVKALSNFKEIASDKSPSKLLNGIKSVMFHVEDERKRAHTLVINDQKLALLKRQPHWGIAQYYKRFTTHIEVIENSGGCIPAHPALVYEELIYMKEDASGAAIDADNPTKEEREKAEVLARDSYLGVCFTLGLGAGYESFVAELEHQYLNNNDNYPNSLEKAYMVALHRKPTQAAYGATNDGAAFINVADPDDVDDPQEQAALVTPAEQQPSDRADRRRCWACGETGHLKGDERCSKFKGTRTNGEVVQTLVHDLGDDDGAIKWNFNLVGAVTDGNGVPMVDCNSVSERLSLATGAKFISALWILLDTCSTIDLFCNPNLVRNIRKSSQRVAVYSNGGVTYTNLIADLPGYPLPVWFSKDAIANILGMCNVIRMCRVTFDSEAGNEFIVHRLHGRTRRFGMSGKGLYHCDVNEDRGMDFEEEDNNAASLLEAGEIEETAIETVEQRKSRYTNRDYLRAVEARRFQETAGFPSTADLLRHIDNKLIANCPVRREDVAAAEYIWGPSVSILKGKTTRRKGKGVAVAVTALPPQVMERYIDVALAGDVMKVNGIPFLVTVSRSIKYITTEALGGMSAKCYLSALDVVLKTYRCRGFRILCIHMDGAFQCLQAALADRKVGLNICSRGEHVPEIERCIRTVKERTRCCFSGLPFKKKRIPRRIIIEMVYASSFWLDALVPADGVSKTQSPLLLIRGIELDYERHVKLKFGTYVQTHEEHSNDMEDRSVGAIALRPTGNAQGGFYFYNLHTGKRINRLHYTALPMPPEVVERIDALGARERVGDAGDDGITFWDRYPEMDPANVDVSGGDVSDPALPERSAGVNEADEAHQHVLNDDLAASIEQEASAPEKVADNATPVAAVETAGVGVETTGVGGQPAETAGVSESTPETTGVDEPTPGITDAAPARVREVEVETVATDENVPETNVVPDESTTDPPRVAEERVRRVRFVDEADPTVATPAPDAGLASALSDHLAGKRSQEGYTIPLTADQQAELDKTMDLEYGDRNKRGLRPRKARREPLDYTHIEHAGRKPRAPSDHAHLDHAGLATLFHFSMTQYNMKQGVKIFGERGVDAVLTEVQQLHDRKVMKPIAPCKLTRNIKRAALNYLMFLKEKRCGKIKGRGCADGRKQRIYKTKEETTAPTVHTESLMLSCVVDAMEGRDVATVDIPGAFMQADIDEFVAVRLTGTMVELLVKEDPTYADSVVIERGEKVLYCKLLKALYGTVQAAMLFYTKLSKQLESWGFEINPYDICVANKTIDGKQCTILWHVDDLKISHVDASVVTQIIEDLDSVFGQEVVRGQRAAVTFTRGKVHDYLGMKLDFSQEGKVMIDMEAYIDGMLDECPEEFFTGEVKSCAAGHLLDVNPGASKLEKERAELFHHLTAKAMFLCKRARPDIQLPVAFLATRVREPDEDDWKKLSRMMLFIKLHRDVLTLEASSCNVIKWWVDASFAVHPDRKSHTGAVMMPGKGAVFAKSSKQKLNTKSSTEAELVGADDLMGDVLWTRYFLQWQGWGADDNIIYRDNESDIKMENNGKASCTKRTKHIDIRYFFITDRIKSGEVRVAYCPTLEMIGDYFTKPLQGRLFHKFRALIMNIPWTDNKVNDVVNDALTPEIMVDGIGCSNAIPQECVERTVRTSTPTDSVGHEPRMLKMGRGDTAPVSAE